jgi:oligopeptidase B
MRKLFLLLLLLTLSMTIVAQDNQAEMTASFPPTAKKAPHQTEIHGQVLTDDYFWLREKSNPEVAQYLETENAYSDAIMKPTEKFQEALYNELVSHIKETDVKVPYRERDYFYYSRTVKGQNYPIMARKKKSLDGPEEIMADMNEMAKGEKFFALGAATVNPDGNLFAYSTDVTGFRQYTLHIKDLRTGQVLPEKMEKVESVVWANDGKTLFYSTEDEAKRQYRWWRHVVGTDPKSDVLIYEEKDELFRIFGYKTRDDQYLVLGSVSHTTAEARVLRADDPTGEWKLVQPREHQHEYYVDHHGSDFWIRTNKGGRNFRLVKAAESAPGIANWKEVVPHREEVMLEDFDMFKNHYVLFEREGGLPQLTVVKMATGEKHRIQFPEPAYSVYPENNKVFDTNTFRYAYQSMVTPMSIFDYDMDKRQSTLLKETEVPGGFDRKNYQAERIFATAKDGTKIPISLVYRKGFKRDGSHPALLYAYGSYGASMSANFSSNRLALLDRGMVFAIAHIRGGSELGKKWHDDGRMMKKMNTFTDFIASAEHLIAEKYTSKDRLAIEGGSAGGLLMGAVTNMRPDLFKVVVSHVPFVDVLNTMLDEDLPLTVGEFEEWGNPKNPEHFAYMKQYDPYRNLGAKEYPTMLVKTSFNDSQVMYWEPAKYVAKLRTLKKDKNPLLLKTNMAAGHGGASGRYDRLKEIAFDYAFVLSQLGIWK